MDSLLASYASSDEEDDHQQPQHQPQPTPPPHPPQSQPSSKASFLFSSLPKPQSNSSVFLSLPPPKSSSSSSSQTPLSFPPPKPKNHTQQDQYSKSSALFSSLPAPKSQQTTDFNIPPPNPKRVVQFRPPVPQLSKDEDDDEDEEEDKEERERKKRRQLGQGASVKSFLCSMPVPKNSAASTLGAGAASSLGSGRRSIIETGTSEPASSGSDVNGVNNSQVGYDSNNAASNQGSWDYQSYGYNNGVGAAADQSYAGYEGYSAYGSSGGYDSYGNSVQYESGWHDASSGAVAPEASGAMATLGGVESFVRVEGKRRKAQVPAEIVEVKQDELIKNRPREDQSKLTGIAFGPSYQPAPSGKGKPNKLAKRKHQIGALYFDMRQKEMELAERRSKGLLTKAETQAKYGW